MYWKQIITWKLHILSFLETFVIFLCFVLLPIISDYISAHIIVIECSEVRKNHVFWVIDIAMMLVQQCVVEIHDRADDKLQNWAYVKLWFVRKFNALSSNKIIAWLFSYFLCEIIVFFGDLLKNIWQRCDMPLGII